MTLLFITLPAALIIAAGAVAAFMWAARNDQYEDLDTPPRRMLLEDPTSARPQPEPGQRKGGHDEVPGSSSTGTVQGPKRLWPGAPAQGRARLATDRDQ